MDNQRPARQTVRACIATLWLALLIPCPAAAQPTPRPDATAVYEVVLRDGSRLLGTIESDEADVLTIRTAGGVTVTVPRRQIASLREQNGVTANGEFLPPDPNATRLFFGPTGRALGRGKTYLGVYEFLMPFVQVGVTDRLSIGGGTPLIFGLDDWDRPFWVTPKLQIVNGAATQAAVGVFHVFDRRGNGGGIGYLVATHGGARGSFTAGAGVNYGFEGGRSGVVMIGGERRVRRNLALVSESYVWGRHGIATGGVRLIGDRLSADLALGVPIGTTSAVAFPVVNFVYAF